MASLRLNEGLRVVFNNDRHDVKHVTFPQLDIEVITRVICERFSAENVSLEAAIEGDSDRYSITTNDDVKELWKSIIELHVTGKKKRSDDDMTVAISKELYLIDATPDPRSEVVLKAQREFGVSGSMEDAKKSFERMCSISDNSYFAAAATWNREFRPETKDLGFCLTETCRVTKNTIMTFITTSVGVNETLNTFSWCLRQNDYTEAYGMLSSLCETTQECIDKTKEMMVKIDEFCDRKILSSETSFMLQKEREKAEKFEKEQEMKELELKDVQSQIKELTQPGAKSTLQKVVSNFFRVGYIAYTCTEFSETRLPVVAVGKLLGYAASMEKDEEKKKEEERKRLEEQYRKKLDAEKHEIQLNYDLQQLQKDIEGANKDDKCYHFLGGELLKTRSDFETLKSFSEDLLVFWQGVKKSEERLMAIMKAGQQKAEGGEEMEGNCRKLLSSLNFKEQLINYWAKYVTYFSLSSYRVVTNINE